MGPVDEGQAFVSRSSGRNPDDGRRNGPAGGRAIKEAATASRPERCGRECRPHPRFELACAAVGSSVAKRNSPRRHPVGKKPSMDLPFSTQRRICMMGRERRASRNGRSVRGFSLASFEAKRASAMKLISITLAALVAGSA
ncbi:MAG: hypothetical protein KDJ40_01050, partial [Hyphomicrobiales bacterium]|nr:hypothetical protein [Hyphomicrobiales bacterium]